MPTKASIPPQNDVDPIDRQFVDRLTVRLRLALRKTPRISLLKDSIHKTTTGGIRTSVARVNKMRLEVWYDQYAQYPKRRLWYGYYWPSSKSFKAVFAHWQEYVQREFVRGDSNATSTIPYHFKKNLEASDFRRPFLEQYGSSDEYFFGCFDFRCKTSRPLVAEISKFFQQTLTAQSTITIEHIYPRKMKILEKLEVQRLYKALRFDRASAVAKERKKRDGYKCHICGFDFAKAYPGLGAQFAEAHHVEPLGRAKQTKVKITPSNLRTLCANCHRMVHRAEVRFKGNPLSHVIKAWRRGARTK